MKGSGLEDAVKSVSRALRGHFLVESALISQLTEPLISNENNFEQEEMEHETCSNTMPRKVVIKIDDLLIEIENITDAIKERKSVANIEEKNSRPDF